MKINLNMLFLYVIFVFVFFAQHTHATSFAINHHICDITNEGYERATISLEKQNLTSYQITIILGNHNNTQYETILTYDKFNDISENLCMYAYISSLISPSDLSVKIFSNLMSVVLGQYLEFTKCDYVEHDDVVFDNSLYKSVNNMEKSTIDDDVIDMSEKDDEEIIEL